MPTASELAQSTADLTRAELRELNYYLDLGGKISEKELGASSTIQTLASNINALTGTDRDDFDSDLNSFSGGERDKHWPC